MAVAALPAQRLTERSATGLAAAIRGGELSSRDVVEAHIELLERVQPRINALAADRFAAARSEADAADARIAAAGAAEELPPLLGVPCTVKESMAFRGMPNCSGLVCRRDRLATETAPVVQRVLDAGAIPVGVTNTSELTMWIESFNRVYGRTRNVYDPTRIAGGSSGGEGAAVGSGGSPFGLGSDVGGSIRLPAFFNGVFGHKPSPGLVPNTGEFPSGPPSEGRLLSKGPIARRAEDLMPVLRIMAGPDGQDSFTRSIELGDPDEVELTGLPVVLSEEASLIPVRRELRDARDRAAEALAAAGADLRRVSLRSLRRALELYVAALADASGDTRIHGLLAAEGSVPARLRTAIGRNAPHTPALLMLIFGEWIEPRLPARLTRRALAAGRSLATEVEGVIGDGVLLHPPFARVAPRHGRTVFRPWVVTPVAAFNLLGLPVTQVPLGLNRRRLPLGVQVVGGRDRDHVTIAVALELERALGGWVPPGG